MYNNTKKNKVNHPESFLKSCLSTRLSTCPYRLVTTVIPWL